MNAERFALECGGISILVVPQRLGSGVKSRCILDFGCKIRHETSAIRGHMAHPDNRQGLICVTDWFSLISMKNKRLK